MPPLPPGPGLPEGLLKPPFSGHPDGPLIAVWDADLKVTTPFVAGRDAPCAVAQWPLSTAYNLSGWTAAGTPAWGLNDPQRTVDLMAINNIVDYLVSL